MKKILTLIIAFVAMSVQTVLAQTPKVILQHEGNVTLYEANALRTAINAASAGDTIYLSEGTFISEITINKRLSIIGAGQSSKIDGSITIQFNDADELTNHPRILDALYCSGYVYVKGILNDLNIRKCSFKGIDMNYSTTNVKDGLIDRCYISGAIRGDDTYVKNFIVQNSKINTINSDCSNFTFQNCNIYQLNYSGDFRGKLTNSIIGNNTAADLNIAVIAINTLFRSSIYASSAQCQHCYKNDTSGLISSSSLDCFYSKESLLSKGYVGIDGTCVGVEGGTTPYTLVPNTPSVYDSNISVDTDANKLNVSLKVKVE